MTPYEIRDCPARKRVLLSGHKTLKAAEASFRRAQAAHAKSCACGSSPSLLDFVCLAQIFSAPK